MKTRKQQQRRNRENQGSHVGIHSNSSVSTKEEWNENTAAMAAIMTGGGKGYLERTQISLPEAGTGR